MSVLIAGGGVAGAAAACALGAGATLLEREPGAHDKVCGEFVSWEAQAELASLGVDLRALGGAPIGRVRLVHGDRVAESALPGVGLGLTRRRLDEALLAQAEAAGSRVLRGHAVRRVVPGGLEVDGPAFNGRGRLEADRVLLATGKHDLRGWRRPADGPALVGLKMYFSLAAVEREALEGAVEVVLFPGGYAGLQLVEGGLANLCLLITEPAFAEAGRGWAGVVRHMERHSPHLARRLAGAEAQLARPVAIARVPYGFVHRPAADDLPGVFRLGDQVGVIPSFSGDGMAIALHSALAAVGAADAPAYHAAMRRRLGPQVGRAMALHRAGLARPAWVAAAARAWPGAMAWVARLTRVA